MEDAVRVPIYELFAKAKRAILIGDTATADELCDAAWARMPEPKFGWDVTYVCLRGTVTYLRAAGRYDKALGLVNDYLASDYYLDYQDGPYFWLGTLHYEKGEMAKAYEHFDRANAMSRGRCFVEEDPRYVRFFKDFKASSSLPR